MESFAPDRIAATITLRLYADQPRVLQHTEMLRHGGPAHGLRCRQLPHCFGRFAQRLEDPAVRANLPLKLTAPIVCGRIAFVHRTVWRRSFGAFR